MAIITTSTIILIMASSRLRKRSRAVGTAQLAWPAPSASPSVPCQVSLFPSVSAPVLNMVRFVKVGGVGAAEESARLFQPLPPAVAVGERMVTGGKMEGVDGGWSVLEQESMTAPVIFVVVAVVELSSDAVER
ncbi:hypothetical protein RJ55_04374 [Drechmeria coniospora]|nr:hypothetical protein RJ55_04374 [Drechmeria coniospora]